MQALLNRTTAAVIRNNGLSPTLAPVSARAAAALRPQQSLATPPNLPQQAQQAQQRGLAVERMVYGMKITDDMKVSEPVRRVLSIDNADM